MNRKELVKDILDVIHFVLYNPWSFIFLYGIGGIMCFVYVNVDVISKYEEGDCAPLFKLSVFLLIVLSHFLGWLLIKKSEEVEYLRERYENKITNIRSEVDSQKRSLITSMLLKSNELERKNKKIETDLGYNYEIKVRDLEKAYNNRTDELDKSYRSRAVDLESKYHEKKVFLEECERRMERILLSEKPFSLSASLSSDMKMYIFKDSIYYLEHKDHPAISAAETLREMKKKAKNYVKSYNEMKYKYEFILNVFPELSKYVDDDEALCSLSEMDDYTDFQEKRDRSADFLSKEEWDKMDTDTRNQLALDRYKKKNKSNWVIGIEYEMYVEYVLRENGYKTIPHGSLKGVKDLGRDIIAHKTDSYGNNNVYIIQCKNYSSIKDKEIHENVVCQTFGTAMEYQINHKLELFTRIVPVIYSTVPLSETASIFAEKLGVVSVLCKKGDYPMIKCNIGNNGEKIYHLPFDQQYYRTEIKSPGEFYAWTVEEAVNAGFRRAFKYRP